jgi:HPt (histidine-containing phosphotransfer) domain-containing protein
MELPNIEYITKLAAGNQAVKSKLIDTLKFELPLEIDAYYLSVRLEKTNQSAACVHKLKNKIGILGLEQGYHIAEEYENHLKNREKKLQIEFENILTLMQNFVNSL